MRTFAGGQLMEGESEVWISYSDPSPTAALTLLERYGVEYIYVGPLERIMYPKEGLAKFEADPSRFRQVYENPGVRIFRVTSRDAIR